MSYKNILDKQAKIKSNELSLTENVQYFLSRINDQKDINAFNFIFEDVLDDAKVVEEKIHDGTAGKLAGMVIAVKDVLSIKDRPLACSSNILKGFKSIYSATSVQKLIDEDALIIGKTNCDEFAMGSSNENSAFGNVLNPVDKTRVPGGSSGGSAAAVAAGFCDVALGTDTGGSIRQPASFCGVFGLKPTYGRVSRYGLTAFASSFDSIGAFANNVEDIAAVMNVMSGKDDLDSTSINEPTPEFNIESNISRKIKVGIPQEYFSEGLNDEVKKSIEDYISDISSDKVEFIDIHLKHNDYAIATYYILTTAEASANLSRYDGVRFGYRHENPEDLNEMYTLTRSEGFGDEVKRRIMLGTYVLSSGYYDAYYRKAQKVRRLIKEDFTNAFEQVDIILTPTSPFTAFKIGEKSSDPMQMYLSDIYTTSINLAGIPAINIPIGFDSNDLPIGVQLIANQFEENLLLQTVKFFNKS
ncbi:MAG: Asp-tRNA(Asn)/Glu-tRNA(Gln) amidotransferase subunit GatA [Chlorobi bacterium]|nr:Asp-tRNA(Asn)/Glu-tRNA(Gln) amidotransferase subunit GatA [Chlorobiota bacterium]